MHGGTAAGGKVHVWEVSGSSPTSHKFRAVEFGGPLLSRTTPRKGCSCSTPRGDTRLKWNSNSRTYPFAVCRLADGVSAFIGIVRRSRCRFGDHRSDLRRLCGVGTRHDGLLDSYHWEDEFLELNAERTGHLGD